MSPLPTSSGPTVWAQFRTSGIPDELVGKLERAYADLKENFWLGRHRPGELDGGHLAEIALRILQWATGGVPGGNYTPLGTRLPAFDQEVRRMESLSPTYAKSLRVHLPRVLLVLHDIRNGRGVGHPSGDVDPNLADATAVAALADWVLAELVRIFHGVALNQAQRMVDDMVQRRVPLVQVFGPRYRVLNPDLSNPKKILVSLYARGAEGATTSDLAADLRIPAKEARRLLRRHDADALVHFDDALDSAEITRSGIRFVEEAVPLRIESWT